jgi:hypothetical protein
MCLQVPTMVDAATGIDARVGVLVEAADFDVIGAAAFRAHTERSEHRLSAFQRLDRRGLGAPAPSAQLALLLVGGVPA